MSQCCLSGFKWDGKPTGTESTLGNNKVYVTGFNKAVAILIVHDVYGWTANNARVLADQYAKEADATVFLPDFFGGEVVTREMTDNKDKPFDLKAFLGRHSKETRWPEISSCAKALKQEHGFEKLGALGFCYGGWAVFRLGAKGENLVDCIATNHPSLLTKEEIDQVAVPVQINAPENDPLFTPELKEHANAKIPTLGVQYDYQFYPGLNHGFSSRGDPNDPKQRQGLERAKNAVVSWFAQQLHLH